MEIKGIANKGQEKKTFEKIPLGILLLIVATSIEILKEIYAYFTQYNLFFGFQTTGVAFNIVNTILLIFSITVLYGLIAVSGRLFYIMVWYYVIMALDYLFVIFNSSNLSLIVQIKSGGIIIVHLLSIILFGLTIWYLFEKKNLFMQNKDDNRSVDYFFVIPYLILFVLTIILSFAFTAV